MRTIRERTSAAKRRVISGETQGVHEAAPCDQQLCDTAGAQPDSPSKFYETTLFTLALFQVLTWATILKWGLISGGGTWTTNNALTYDVIGGGDRIRLVHR